MHFIRMGIVEAENYHRTFDMLDDWNQQIRFRTNKCPIEFYRNE